MAKNSHCQTGDSRIAIVFFTELGDQEIDRVSKLWIVVVRCVAQFAVLVFPFRDLYPAVDQELWNSGFFVRWIFKIDSKRQLTSATVGLLYPFFNRSKINASFFGHQLTHREIMKLDRVWKDFSVVLFQIGRFRVSVQIRIAPWHARDIRNESANWIVCWRWTVFEFEFLGAGERATCRNCGKEKYEPRQLELPTRN